MSVATASHSRSVTADVVSGGQWLPPARPTIVSQVAETQELKLSIEIPGFDLIFSTALSDMHLSDGYGVVTLVALIDPGVAALVTLKNEVTDSAGNLQIKEISINFDVSEHRPRAHFLASTLYAMLPLAGPIRIVLPALRVDVTTNFSTPLREVSTLLRSRQTYYGLMVIELAALLRLDVPEHITGQDMNSIAFAYHAITEREFDWLAKFITVPAHATEDTLAWLNGLRPTEPGGSVYRLSLGPAPEFRTILGQTVALGPQTVFLEDAVIQNLEDVRREMSELDGRTVPVVIRPLGGMGRYHLPEAPRLPDSPWDEKIGACIELEDQLNERLADRYNELAASTLAGLTPEEIKIVTERPALGEDAHLIKD